MDVDDFKLKPQLASAALKFINLQFKDYQKFQMRNPKVAKVHLTLLRESVILTLKDEVTLEHGIRLPKKSIVDLIDIALKAWK